ncbi:hypothetical protein GCM10020369_53390 [Cryptosporangium minutisporangium]|uniref:Uncharacterized protein n=1 Tax=Cryptosporangium minutisporangium TaxID=113569 RepID=A0ABP6T5N0_9ACTN
MGFEDRAVAGADQRDAGDDVQGLAERVGMPVGAGTGAEPHEVQPGTGGLPSGIQDVPPDVTGEPVEPACIAENFDVFDFELTDAELTVIDGLKTGERGGPGPADITLAAWSRPTPED